ncbi:MAG: amino acid adenylation domain-containing protein [Chromatiaceae bacterium]|nr:amino acid adenylation domain-containing protein [Chromatiaceae bacterium]
MNPLYCRMARNPAYQTPCIAVTAFDLIGYIDFDMVHHALASIVKANNSLCSRLRRGGAHEPCEMIADMDCEVEETDPIDLLELARDEQDAELEWILIDALEEPFDLEIPPLLRYRAVQFGEDHCVVLVLAHRAVFDEFSGKILIDTFARNYRDLVIGEATPLGTINLNTMERALSGSTIIGDDESLNDARKYWQSLLAKIPTQLDLPTESGLSTDPGYYTARCSATIPRQLQNQLKVLIAKEQVPLPIFLLAGLELLLHLLSDDSDITLSILCDRRGEQAGNTIGPFSGILALRVDLSCCPTLSALMARVQASYDEVLQHSRLAPDQVIGADVENDQDLLPIWPWLQVLFRFMAAESQLANDEDLTVTERALSTSTSVHPLAFTASLGHDDACLLTLEYHSDRFSEATANRMLELYQSVLTLMAANIHTPLEEFPAALCREPAMNVEPESIAPRVHPQSALMVRPDCAGVAADIGQVFLQCAKVFADRIAIKTRDEEWNYAQLAHRSVSVSRAIIDRCGDGNSRVALLFAQEPDSIVAIMGALIAGKTYVPMDAAMPDRRLREILEDADVSLLLTIHEHAELARLLVSGATIIEVDQLPSDAKNESIRVSISPQDSAYIIYTSGSTGRPKGVVQSHANVLYHNRAYSESLGISQNDRLTLLPVYTFDAAVMDLFGALLNGAALHLYNLKRETSQEIVNRMVHEAVTIYHSTPTVYRYLQEGFVEDLELPNVRFVVLGGEAVNRLDFEAYRRYFGNAEGFVSTYSSTESTVAMMLMLTTDTDWDEAIGSGARPVPGTEILLRNAAGIETPLYGEICIRSEHVALGYWRQPELTRAVFADEPGTGRRIYRSGDMGRRLTNGRIRCCGRKDAQVKIRGNRVELGDIEAALSEHEQVEQCAVIALSTEDAADMRLHAVCRARDRSAIPTDQALIAFLGQRLPSYMIPGGFAWISDFPLTASGKIDRKRLKALI